jgi:hypothetical protein
MLLTGTIMAAKQEKKEIESMGIIRVLSVRGLSCVLSGFFEP